MTADGPWDRVTYRLDPRTEGPEPQDIAMKAYLDERSDAPRIAGAELASTDEHGHWVDIWLDPEEEA
jgi:hypothetical protein